MDILVSKIQAGDVVTMKTLSGEELVSKYVGETEEMYTVSKPMVLVPNGNTVGLMPYVFTVGDLGEVKLRKSAFVVAAVKTVGQVAEQYSQMTSGIQKATTMPDASGLIT